MLLIVRDYRIQGRVRYVRQNLAFIPTAAAHDRPTPNSPRVLFCVPIKLPESAVEEDICGFVLSVDARICRQPFLDEASNDRVFMAKGPQPLNRVGTSGLLQVKPMDGASVDSLTSAAMAAAQADHACLSNFEASAEMHKCALPEMRRLQGHFERWVRSDERMPNVILKPASFEEDNCARSSQLAQQHRRMAMHAVRRFVRQYFSSLSLASIIAEKSSAKGR